MATRTASRAGRSLKKFGWQGIELTVPADWELVSTHGTHESGYVALADASATRLELKWDVARGGFAPDAAAERYLRHVRSSARKAGQEARIKRGLRLVSLAGKETECYEWSAGRRGVAMVSRCEECGRVVHVMVLGAAEEPLRGLARTVFASLQDHPTDGLLHWRFYDLEFTSPAGMSLARPQLKTGCIRMLFRGRRTELEFVRVSLAQVLLARRTLREWFGELFSSELRSCGGRIVEAQYRGHPCVRVEGRLKLMANPARLIGRGREMRMTGWHCPESNRLLAVRHTAPAGQEATFSRALESLRCC